MISLEPETSPAAPLVITLFGPMQALVGGRPLPRLRSHKALWLLALLALRPGRLVEREWLAETLWPDTGLDRGGARLRPVLSELRKALGSAGERLQSPTRGALSLDTAGVVVDALQFDAAISAGTLPALERAVALYRGPLLEDCAEEWADQEREARKQDCLRALEILADAAIAAEDWRAAANHARRAVTLDPWREAARRDLMEALARGGDVNAALQVYRELVSLLREDPKAAPDEQTTALYRRLRAGAAHSAAALGVISGNAAKAEPGVSGYLPSPLTDLIGREDEREDIVAVLRRSRLVTLTGVGGIGKTRLAAAVAKDIAGEYPDGVWLAALESLTQGDRIPAQIAETLGLKEEHVRSPLELLVTHLRSRRLLIVLDNCEHLLEASAQVAGRLLRECEGLRILATSREALRIVGEAAWAVPGLTAPDPGHLPASGAALLRVLAGYDSVRLFAARAPRPFALTAENARTVAQICARLGGIPLALELAAARGRAMTAAQIAARLDNHLGLLTDGDRGAPSRQQTLRATLDWSYALLSVPEQLLLARVSVFAGGWNLDAAEAVCSGEGVATEQTLDLLTSLVDKSLVSFEERPTDAGGRYRLLEMVRQYAAEQLGQGEAADLARTRHRDWFLALVEQAGLQLWGAVQTAEQRRLEPDHDNLREALAWSETDVRDPEAGLRLASALTPFWFSRSEYSEGRMFLRRALDRADARQTTQTRGKALNGAARLADRQGDYASARTLYEQSLVLYRELGVKKEIARALGNLGWLAHRQGDAAASQTFCAEARTCYEEQLSVQIEAEDWEGSIASLNALAILAYNRGDYASARTLLDQNLEITVNLGNNLGSSRALNNLGTVAYNQGDLISARAFFERGLDLLRPLDCREDMARCLYNLGCVARAQDDPVSAREALEEGLDIRREIGDKKDTAQILNELVRAARDEGAFALARLRQEESILLSQELGDQVGLAEGLEGMAMLLLKQSEAQKAVRLWSAAHALRENIGAQLSPEDHQERDPLIKRAQATLDLEVFARAWDEGRSLTWKQAVEHALEESL